MTAEVARSFVDKNRTITAWKLVTANVRETLRAHVHQRLAEEEIPEVQPDVFRWRMDQAMRNTVKSGKTGGNLHKGTS